MDKDIARIIGGIYIALCSALGEQAALAHDTLFRWADSEDIRPDDQRIYRLIAEAASGDVETLRAENARFDWLEANPRPNLRVVGGTAFEPA